MSDELPPVASPGSPRIRNVGRAVVVGLCPLIFLVFAMLPSLTKVSSNHPTCMSYVKQIGLACAMYADTNDGRLPQTLDSLTNGFSSSTKIFICPSVGYRTNYSYAFTGVTNKWNDGSNVIILREIEPHDDGTRTLLFNDGHVEQRKD